jgi:hypothetical protein
MKHPTSKSNSAEGISSFSSMEPINKNKINIFPNYWELGSGITTYNLRRIETSSDTKLDSEIQSREIHNGD